MSYLRLPFFKLKRSSLGKMTLETESIRRRNIGSPPVFLTKMSLGLINYGKASESLRLTITL